MSTRGDASAGGRLNSTVGHFALAQMLLAEHEQALRALMPHPLIAALIRTAAGVIRDAGLHPPSSMCFKVSQLGRAALPMTDFRVVFRTLTVLGAKGPPAVDAFRHGTRRTRTTQETAPMPAVFRTQHAYFRRPGTPQGNKDNRG